MHSCLGQTLDFVQAGCPTPMVFRVMRPLNEAQLVLLSVDEEGQNMKVCSLLIFMFQPLIFSDEVANLWGRRLLRSPVVE